MKTPIASASPVVSPASPKAALSRRQWLQPRRRRGVGAWAFGIAVAPVLSRMASAATRTSIDPSEDPLFMSATRLAQWIREKKVSASEVVRLHIERIRHVDPILNAVVTPCFDRALKEARAADDALARGELKGALHGVPITLKDSLDTEGVISTGGTQGRSHFIPQRDATSVARLRAAGAILLGKTNTPEFTTGGVSGLGTTANILYGMTRNPYNPRYTTYGSSGGAGAIVAAGGSAFDFYQQLGPMVRRVEDLVTILPIVSGPDYTDAAIHDVPLEDPATVELKSLRVAFYTQQGPGAAGASNEVVGVIMAAARALADAGCSVTEDLPPRIMEAIELRGRLTRADGNAWQKRLTERYGTIVSGPARRFDQPQVPVAEFVAMLERQDEIKTEILTFMENYDLLICPVRATPLPPIGDPDNLAGLPGASFTAIYNVTGYPAGVVRGGSCRNQLPIGVQVVGRPWCEHTVFAAMAHLEKSLGGYQRVTI